MVLLAHLLQIGHRSATPELKHLLTYTNVHWRQMTKLSPIGIVSFFFTTSTRTDNNINTVEKNEAPFNFSCEVRWIERQALTLAQAGQHSCQHGTLGSSLCATANPRCILCKRCGCKAFWRHPQTYQNKSGTLRRASSLAVSVLLLPPPPPPPRRCRRHVWCPPFLLLLKQLALAAAAIVPTSTAVACGTRLRDPSRTAMPLHREM